MMNRVALLCLVGLAPLVALGQEPKAVVEISPDTCLVGDNVFYSLALTRGERQFFILPVDTDEVAFFPFEIRSRKKLSEEERDGVVTERWQYALTIFDTGAQIVPPLDLRYADASGRDTGVLRLDSKMIYVRSVLDTTVKDINDIKPIQTLPVPAWVYVAGALALALLVAGGYWLFASWRKRRKTEKPKLVVPEKSPYQVALEKLAALESYPLETQEDFKKFYSDLSDLLRELIERAYDIPALEQITSEILAALQAKIRYESVERYRRIFERADLVKFAKFYPSKIEARESLSLAKEIVADFAPKPEPATPSANYQS
ncbi:MAG: DUF4381 family protein [Chloroherpetonaceae bacterium]|nr:DUF4381 family protein [Chloroherpetonaceae bacterium]MDW8438604.1 DUF4381 family protein [Chloroherpetonaceae bacterium]